MNGRKPWPPVGELSKIIKVELNIKDLHFCIKVVTTAWGLFQADKMLIVMSSSCPPWGRGVRTSISKETDSNV